MHVETIRPEPAAPRLSIGSAGIKAPTSWLALDDVQQQSLIASARDPRSVNGLTHRHYQYPARFSPILVGQAIDTFTSPGDLVIDPYVGGGTTLVEAHARGRRAIGSDISTLAAFVSRAKLLTLTPARAEQFLKVASSVADQINMQRPEPSFDDWAQLGYFRNLGTSKRWRLRKAIAQAVAAIEQVDDPDLESLARCAILRTAHWALDGRKQLPSADEFRYAVGKSAILISEGAQALRTAHLQYGTDTPQVLNRSIIGLDNEEQVKRAGAPRLIITSPPYPGVHVLYHRWQVDGRKESPAPFFIAKALDGSGESYYTMGGRKGDGLPVYFDQLRAGLRSLAAIADKNTTLMQVVAFAQPEWQLERYLEVAAEAGWEERGLPALRGEEDGRLWRAVPNRKWHANSRGKTGAAREVVLIHRLSGE